ncbi:MAG TPA: hypothetical protein VIV06_10155 [Candidatus Limnocylindrales bacterium]
MWPRLDAHALKRAGDDPVRIARVVARRTALPLESILRALLGIDGSPGSAISPRVEVEDSAEERASAAARLRQRYAARNFEPADPLREETSRLLARRGA